MNKIFILVLSCLFSLASLYGHQSHKEVDKSNSTMNETIREAQDTPEIEEHEGRPESWLEWIGGFHFIFLHFPIALVAMTAISELLFAWHSRPIFDYASRFMLTSGAILAAPTALLGLAYSYTETYAGIESDLVWWHMWFGLTTAIFAIFVAFIREHWGISKFYYACLILLLLLMNFTGFLGGEMTFGPYHMYPPL